jgi:hypothetical protein
MSKIINVGPMEVYHVLDSTSGALLEEMPPTQGGTSFAFSFETLDSVADKTGNMPRNSYFVGGEASFTVNYTEMTMEEILALFPVTEGNAVTIPVGCSTDDYEIGLLLKPIICGGASEEEEDWIYAPRVLAVPQFSTEFSLSTQRIWTVEYKVMPANPRLNDFKMIYFGEGPDNIIT